MATGMLLRRLRIFCWKQAGFSMWKIGKKKIVVRKLDGINPYAIKSTSLLQEFNQPIFILPEKTSIHRGHSETNLNNIVNSAYLWYIVPGYNEESRLSETLDYLTSLQPLLKSKGLKMNVVLVDDGSRDNTYKIMKDFADNTGNFAVRIKHGGRGAALRAGIKFVQETNQAINIPGIIAFSAADLKLPLEDICESCQYISVEGWGAVFLSKNLPGSLMIRSFSRRFLSLLFNKLVCLLFNFRYTDTQGVKFVKLDEETFKILDICTDQAFTYDTEVAIELNLNGKKIKEIPYHIEDSSEEDSKVNFFATMFMALGILNLVKKTSVRRVKLLISKLRP